MLSSKIYDDECILFDDNQIKIKELIQNFYFKKYQQIKTVWKN